MFNLWPSTIYQPTMTGSTQQPVLPASLAKHPQQWTKHEVGVWLKWCAEEYCIEPIPPDRIDMNGKALCLLKRSDFMERIPKNGDLLFNALQKLLSNKGNISSPMSSICNVGATVPMSPFQIKAEPMSPLLPPFVLTSANTQTTSMHAPSVPRPCVPILPRTQTSILPPTCSNPVVHSNKHYSNSIVSTVAGILSPAPSNVDTESASSDGGSVSDPEAQDNENNRHLNDSSERFLPTTIKTEIQHSVQSAFQTVHNKPPESECRLLWEFIHQLLQNRNFSQLVCWESEKELIFRINNPTGLANMWGQQKNRTNMTYEKLSRALRYYYRMNIIKKVSGKRLTYKFMQQPSTIQKGQRGAKPHNKCDLPLFPTNRFSFPGIKGETNEENIPHSPNCGPFFNDTRQHSESYKINRHQVPVDSSTNSTKNSSPKFSKNRELDNFDQGLFPPNNGELKNANVRHLSPKFPISQNVYDKNNSRKPSSLMIHTHITNDATFSPDVKLNLGTFGMISPTRFDNFHRQNSKQGIEESMKRRYTDEMSLSPRSELRNNFKEEPQVEPEDLSLAGKKRRRDSDNDSDTVSMNNDEKLIFSKDEDNNILPLLINYRKTPISADS